MLSQACGQWWRFIAEIMPPTATARSFPLFTFCWAAELLPWLAHAVETGKKPRCG